ncbi:putative 5-oxoprolinase, partial [Aureobasidium melanogenum]
LLPEDTTQMSAVLHQVQCPLHLRSSGKKELSFLPSDWSTKNPGCSGSRCYKDNVADLKAQIAANHCGIRLIRQMILEYTMEAVHMYMGAIQDAAELSIRNLFKKIAQGEGSRTVSASDYMDDGTAVVLNVKMNGENGSATFDFSGTGPEVLGNWNAPIAITTSAIIYALRCMVDSDIPLNHGCIKPIDIVVPEGSFPNPSAGAAVCAGNVLTSQRIVDVIFRAFETCAASQGCMNNFTFGVDGEGGFGYYETICGGSGAGPTWHGTSGVHIHMTNTRITDPESLERRYPVVLREFSLRSGSGGRGEFNGGDGVVRDVVKMVDEVSTPGSAQMVSPGDRFVIQSPGGGAYGASENGQSTLTSSLVATTIAPIAGGTFPLSYDFGSIIVTDVCIPYTMSLCDAFILCTTFMVPLQQQLSSVLYCPRARSLHAISY